MKRNSLVLKYLLITLVSILGALGVLFALAYYSVYVRALPFLDVMELKNVLYALEFLLQSTPWFAWLVIAILVFCTLFFLLSLPMILRIRRISQAVRKIANGEYDVELRVGGKDELSSLERDVHAMAQRIEYAFAVLQEAERSKDEFVVNIAHDLRTPLTSVLGYLSLINSKPTAESSVQEYAGIALQKAQQLSMQINQLFELMRMTPEAMQPKPTVFNGRQFLLQVQDEAFPVLAEAGMRIRIIDVPEDLRINADGQLLSRMYDNLILNATRYAQDGIFIDLGARLEDGQTVLTITTHSNPVPADQLERIFDRLHRLDDSRSSETGGAGLGLAICKRIAELHGGTIQAARTKDGTEFTIRLP